MVHLKLILQLDSIKDVQKQEVVVGVRGARPLVKVIYLGMNEKTQVYKCSSLNILKKDGEHNSI
jgi:hypothetical protein